MIRISNKKKFKDLKPGETLYFIKVAGTELAVIREDIIKSIAPTELNSSLRKRLPPGQYLKIIAYKESAKTLSLGVDESILPTYELIFPAEAEFVSTFRAIPIVYSPNKETLLKWLKK